MPIKNTQLYMDMANRLRIHSIKATTASKSGHPTSCSSIAEIMAVLFFYVMKIKVSDPKSPVNDRFILSKSHASPILYAAWAEAGLFPTSDLLTFRKLGSDLEGYPTPKLKFIDAATGSPGQGLSIACGMAYVGKYYDKASYRIYCLIGDGESAEGSIWESLQFASFYKLNNLCLILDVNRFGQSQETILEHNMCLYEKRLEAFGFNAISIDGHNIEQIAGAFDKAAAIKDMPTAIIAKTLKGKNFLSVENENGHHGKALGDMSDKVLVHLRTLIHSNCTVKLKPSIPPGTMMVPVVNIRNIKLSSKPDYKPNDKVPTRSAYGNALVKLSKSNPRVIALDGDRKNLTYSEILYCNDPSKFIECYLMEQNLIGVAIGAACRDRAVCFVSTFGAFLTRAFDQIRMGAISQSNINICGSHAGVSVGDDGPSQMALEDIAMFRSIPGCTVFYPSDAVSCEKAVELAANCRGITYIRTSCPPSPIVYSCNQVFEIGKANILKQSGCDKILIVTGGVTLNEALIAAEELKKRSIQTRVMDLFTIKPIDRCGILKHASESGRKIVTIEDHYPEGGIGEAVLAAVAEVKEIVVKVIAVRDIPRSGPPTDLLNLHEISAKHIICTVEEMIRSC